MVHFAQAAGDVPLGERLLIAIAGPLVTVILGSLLVGILLSKLSETTTRRRSELDLRYHLISEATRIASSMYLATQRYWRVRKDDPESLQTARALLDDEYVKNRRDARVLEAQLGAYFQCEDAKKTWHAIDDLLTVRYFQVVDRASERLRQANAGDEHSGLTADQLKDAKPVLDRYRTLSAKIADTIRTSELKPIS